MSASMTVEVQHSERQQSQTMIQALQTSATTWMMEHPSLALGDWVKGFMTDLIKHKVRH